jgi:hypothetical protein
MSIGKSVCASALWLLALVLGLTLTVPAAAQKQDKQKEPLPSGTPVLWRAPDDIATRDLLAGPGGAEMKPDLSSITLVKEEPGGYSIKYRVKDGAGREWVVKVGNEARPETAAVRLAWAVGYMTEINYLVPCVHIPGAPKPRKDVKRCEGDGFADARFEARPDDVKRLDTWAWQENPFTGTKELKGLVVLMALMNNWDLKDENNKILLVTGADGTSELRYIISDLGATFGKTGGAISHSRNEPEKYEKTKFVEKLEQGRVRFAYSGKQGELLKDVTVEQAKWIGGLLAQLSDEQLQAAFHAADFTPAEIEGLTAEVRARINALNNLPGAATPATPPGAH